MKAYKDDDIDDEGGQVEDEEAEERVLYTDPAPGPRLVNRTVSRPCVIVLSHISLSSISCACCVEETEAAV